MPQSLSAAYFHLVFSVKERRPFLRDAAVRKELHAYLGSVSARLDCPPVTIGGVESNGTNAMFGNESRLGGFLRNLFKVDGKRQKDPG